MLFVYECYTFTFFTDIGTHDLDLWSITPLLGDQFPNATDSEANVGDTFSSILSIDLSSANGVVHLSGASQISCCVFSPLSALLTSLGAMV